MPKLLTVFGSTGQQGGALIEHVLKNPKLSKLFKLRGITRDALKPSALALAAKGVEVMQADLNDVKSVEKAVVGSDVVFGVTNFWEEASSSVEIAQGKAIADASVKAGVAQLIWSSLPNVTLMTEGEVTDVEHFDSKAEVERYIRTLAINSVFFMAGWYMQNQLSMFRPRKELDGTYSFFLPFAASAPLPLIDIRDTGKFLEPALLDPQYFHGKNLTCATAFYTPVEMAATWSKVTGKTGNFVPTEDKFEKLVTYGGYFGKSGQKDLEWTLAQIKQELRTWEKFVEDNMPWSE